MYTCMLYYYRLQYYSIVPFAQITSLWAFSDTAWGRWAQVSFRGGVRATLAALLQVPADSVEAAVSARGPGAQPALVTRSAAGAVAPVITDSFDISALVALPVRPTTMQTLCL